MKRKIVYETDEIVLFKVKETVLLHEDETFVTSYSHVILENMKKISNDKIYIEYLHKEYKI